MMVDSLNQKYNNLAKAINKINKEYSWKSNFILGKLWHRFKARKSIVSKNCGQTKYEQYNRFKKRRIKKTKLPEYKDYLSEQKDIARKSFKCISIEYYNDTGRIKYMEFTEK